MPLPVSGEISIQDINVEINSTQPTVTRDLLSAGIIFELDVDPINFSDNLPGLGMDEFYGQSLTGLEVDPTSFQFASGLSSKVFDYTSRDGVISAISNRAFFVVSNVGTTLPTGSFTVTALSNAAVGSPARSGSITLSNPVDTIIIPITQNAGPPPVIGIDPTIREVGGLDTFANFVVSTNAPSYSAVFVPEAGTPNFVTNVSIDGIFVNVTFNQNNEIGATPREGNIVVQTITGFQTEVQAIAVLNQSAAPPESITVIPDDGNFEIPVNGINGKVFNVTTVGGYDTTWNPVVDALPGDDASWATITSLGTSGNGPIVVNFGANPIGGSFRTIFIEARKEFDEGIFGRAVVSQDANPASLELIPNDDVDIDINGNGSFTLISNSPWFITIPVGSFIVAGNISPTSSPVSGTFTITINAAPRSVGTPSPQSTDITISTDAPGGTNVVRTDYTLIQAAHPATIKIIPNTLSIGGFGTPNFFFGVDTNTTFNISLPSFINLISSDSNGFLVEIEANETGAERTAFVTVTTTSAGTNVIDSCEVTQAVKPPEQLILSPSGPVNVPSTGQSNIEFTVTVDPNYPTLWNISKVDITGNPAPNITFSGTTSSTTNGTFFVNVSSTTVTQTLRTIIRVTNSSTGKTDETLIEQAAFVPFVPTLTVSPTTLSQFNISGGPAQNVTITSNTSWSISNIANFVNVSPTTTGTGNTTISISAAPRPVGQPTVQNNTLTITTTSTSPGSINQSRNVSLSQAGNPATITLNPPTVNPVGFNPPSEEFSVTTNANDYTILHPSFITIGFKTEIGFVATWTNNTTGSPRSGTITVTTITGGTEEVATCNFTQDIIVAPTISIDGPTIAPTGGSSGNVYTITSNGSWSVSAAAFDPFTAVPITFTTSTSGTGNGSVTATFGAYDGNGTDNSLSVITAVAILDGASTTANIEVSQSPPATTTTTTTTTTTLAPQSRFAQRIDGGATGRVNLAQGFGEGDKVLVNDGSGQCWTLGALSTLSPTLTITGPCPPPTTTPPTTTTTAAPCTEINMQFQGSSSSGVACNGQNSASRRRHNGSGASPEIGDTIFSNSTCTTTFNGNNLFFFVLQDGSVIQVNSSGIVIDKVEC